MLQGPRRSAARYYRMQEAFSGVGPHARGLAAGLFVYVG
jgi:hypothetical protein